MIFSADMLALVKDRRKTQTRRPVKPGEKHCRYRVGHVYQAQPGRGKPGVFPVTILDVREKMLGDITPQDAKREGFRFTAQFFEKWRELYGSVDEAQAVWVITFAYGDLRDNFDRPRLLAALSGHTGDGVDEHQDYTDRPELAMRGEPEAVDARSQRNITAQGTLRWQQERAHREAARARQALHERLRELERRYKLGEAKLEPQLRVIRQQIRDLQRRAA